MQCRAQHSMKQTMLAPFSRISLLRVSTSAALRRHSSPLSLLSRYSTMPFESTTLRKASSSTVAASSSSPTTTTTTTPTTTNLSTLETLEFSNTFTSELPADPNTTNSIRQVNDALFSYVDPTPTATEPTLITASPSVATHLLALAHSEFDRPEFAMIFSGNALFPTDKTRAYAQCYGGHQFGSWAGQLGDGRAISLGQVLNPHTGERWELQLKGAGRTPYSRFADGRAVLRSSIREYVASEAMHYLGVPTTRALSLVATGDAVLRDMFYNGNAQMEAGAVVCRVSRSFIRFGTFQLPVSRENQTHLARDLADYVIRHHYPDILQAHHENNSTNRYAALLVAVAQRTGKLVAEWHRVGFVHGVLNTDNMSILGETIDYGPYGWLERFNPDFTPNTTDLPGRRYSFHAQPEIGQFNVLQLARTLVLAGMMTEEEARAGLVAYGEALTEHFSDMMARKMGLRIYDRVLVNGLLKEMFEDGADYTNTFRALGSVGVASGGDDGDIPQALASAIGLDALGEGREQAWRDWVRLYRVALREAGWSSEEERRGVQDAANPVIVPRNHVLVGIIGAAEEGDYGPLHRYLDALKTPYSEGGEEIEPGWLEPGPKAPRMGVELLSCSS